MEVIEFIANLPVERLGKLYVFIFSTVKIGIDYYLLQLLNSFYLERVYTSQFLSVLTQKILEIPPHVLDSISLLFNVCL